MRRALAIVLLIVAAAAAKPAMAQTVPAPTGPAPIAPAPTVPRVTTPEVPSGCVGHSIGEPECGVKPQHSGDRGGWAQELLFLLVLAGMAVIFTVVIRSTRARARASSAP